MRLDRAFFERPVLSVAPDLLGYVVTHRSRRGPVSVRLVEVEAYDGLDDPGSHAYRGETARNRVMFGAAGFVYVYFTYGMHWCANAVCGDEGEGVAVLLRAGAPMWGLDAMWAARPAARRERDLANGPAKLCQALGVDGGDDGTDLTRSGSTLTIVDDGTPPPRRPGRGPRVGISVAVDRPWRWYVPGDPHVSRARTRP